MHTLLTDSQTYTRPPAEHGSLPFADPFTQSVLAELEPHVRKIVTEALGEDHADLGRAIAERVAELVARLGIVPEPVARQGIPAAAAAINSALRLLPMVDDDQLPPALDEVLRWAPPIPAVSRVDSDGEVFEARIDTANRDPSRFPDPGTFDIARFPNPHLTFGRGKHYCPGAALARLQMAIAVQVVLADRG